MLSAGKHSSVGWMIPHFTKLLLFLVNAGYKVQEAAAAADNIHGWKYKDAIGRFRNHGTGALSTTCPEDWTHRQIWIFIVYRSL